MDSKKTYQKPMMKRVELRPTEAILTVCKTATTGNAAGNVSHCSPIVCNNIG